MDSVKMLDDVFGAPAMKLEGRAAADEKFGSEHPILYELLTAQPTIGGKVRQVATLTLVAEDGVFKAGLKDRDHSLSVWVSADTVESLFDALEDVLTKRPVPWRKVMEYPNPRNRQRS